MLYKIQIALLLACISTKSFSQIIDTKKVFKDSLSINALPHSTQTNNSAYIIVEIAKSKYFGSESVTMFYDSGKLEDLTGKLFKEGDMSISQKALMCIKYMSEKNYTLISSTASIASSGNFPSIDRVYNYQYIFQQK